LGLRVSRDLPRHDRAKGEGGSLRPPEAMRTQVPQEVSDLVTHLS
jgi:hypothetical protein